MDQDERCEANQNPSKVVAIVLPNGDMLSKRVFLMESVYELKENCLGGHYPNLKDFIVCLCKDLENETEDEKTLEDSFLFDDLLNEYNVIRIRYRGPENTSITDELFSIEQALIVGESEANQEQGRIMTIVLPNGDVLSKRVFSLETAYELKENCLGGHYPNLKDFIVCLCKDLEDETEDDKTLDDGFLFDDLLNDYNVIRIRQIISEASAITDLKPVVKMKKT